MKLIFLYGPPAVGKLTVATELAKITRYKIFHNHLTVDLVDSIFEFGTKDYNRLVHKYRLELIEAAAKANISLIFTYVYAKPNDDKFVNAVIARVKKHNGTVYFVQLSCAHKELSKRVKHPSRKNFRKIKKLKILKEMMKKYDLLSRVPHQKNITIDNTNLSPKETAQRIKKYLSL